MATPRVLTTLKALRRAPLRAVVTVGVFDGVHVAHQRLIRSIVTLARRCAGTSVVITFDPDPQLVLDPAHAPPALMPLDARIARLKALGVDRVWVLPFTKRFARMTARTFIQDILVCRLHAVTVVLGEAFVFGRNRRGDMDTLKAFGFAHGIRVISVPQVKRQGQPVSSSRIRRLIHDGRLVQARALLGRPPALYGVVVRGAGRGRRLGFPTANIQLMPQALPPQGVYAVLLESRTGRGRWEGVMNFGVRPTFGQGPLVCEVHLLKFSGRLLGRSVAVSLIGRLRGERCFPSPEALRRQVRRDVARARQRFSRTPILHLASA